MPFAKRTSTLLGILHNATKPAHISYPMFSQPTSFGSSLPAQSWPGPFSTANEMMTAREEVKRKRQEAMERGDDPKKIVAELNDEYDRLLSTMKWEKKNSIASGEGRRDAAPLKSLVSLCVDLCVKYFTSIESLEGLGANAKAALATALAKQRKINSKTIQILATTQSESLILPECSEICGEDLLTALKKISCPYHDSSSSSLLPCLKVLHLKSCGHSFTDKTAAEIVSNGIFNVLEDLKITGCYRLSDNSLEAILASCSSTLSNLDISCNSKLGISGLNSIASLMRLNLRSVTLDQCTHLTDADIEILANNVDGIQLENLSLVDLFAVTDLSVCKIVKKYGPTLLSLNLSGCVLLTDNAVVSIRENCGRLRTLGLGKLSNLTTPALIALFLTHPDKQPDASSSSQHSSSSNRISFASSSSSSTSTSSTNAVFSVTPSIGPLEAVNLQSVVAVTDDVIIELTHMGKNTLHTLDINGCHQVTSKAVIALWKNCSPRLKNLDISFVRNIKEDTLGLLVDSSPRLESLSVWGCTQLQNHFFNGHSNFELEISGRF